jgi:hypothetical protein
MDKFCTNSESGKGDCGGSRYRYSTGNEILVQCFKVCKNSTVFIFFFLTLVKFCRHFFQNKLACRELKKVDHLY